MNESSESSAKFVKDTSKYWYKAHISRDEGRGFSSPTPNTHVCSQAMIYAGIPSVWREECLFTFVSLLYMYRTFYDLNLFFKLYQYDTAETETDMVRNVSENIHFLF